MAEQCPYCGKEEGHNSVCVMNEIEQLRAALTEMLADLDDPDLIEISAATIARARQAVVNIHDRGETS